LSKVKKGTKVSRPRPIRREKFCRAFPKQKGLSQGSFRYPLIRKREPSCVPPKGERKLLRN